MAWRISKTKSKMKYAESVNGMSIFSLVGFLRTDNLAPRSKIVHPTNRQRFDVALLACCISQSVIEMKNTLTKIIRRVLVSLRTDQRFSMSQKKKRPLI